MRISNINLPPPFDGSFGRTIIELKKKYEYENDFNQSKLFIKCFICFYIVSINDYLKGKGILDVGWLLLIMSLPRFFHGDMYLYLVLQ